MFIQIFIKKISTWRSTVVIVSWRPVTRGADVLGQGDLHVRYAHVHPNWVLGEGDGVGVSLLAAVSCHPEGRHRHPNACHLGRQVLLHVVLSGGDHGVHVHGLGSGISERRRIRYRLLVYRLWSHLTTLGGATS